jgi:hypothetical protein
MRPYCYRLRRHQSCSVVQYVCDGYAEMWRSCQLIRLTLPHQQPITVRVCFDKHISFVILWCYFFLVFFLPTHYLLSKSKYSSLDQDLSFHFYCTKVSGNPSNAHIGTFKIKVFKSYTTSDS